MAKIVIVGLVLLLLFGAGVTAQISGSQTIEWEWIAGHGLATISYSMLEYAIDQNWSAVLAYDSHPLLGRKADISITRFFRPFGRLLYVTAGTQSGFWRSESPFKVYFSLTYRF